MLPQTKTFDKDPTALKLVEMMTDPDFHELPDAYIAKELNISVSELKEYQRNPTFLDWMSRRLPKLMTARLPQLLHQIFNQAIEGKGKQQKMALDLMGLLDKKQEVRSPNITIINNIPDPDDKKEPKPVIEVKIPDSNDGVGTDD